MNSWLQRSRRARFLAESYPACREILTFYSGLADWQGSVSTRLTSLRRVDDVLPSLLDLVKRTGSHLLADTARELELDRSPLHGSIQSYWDGRSNDSACEFFSRSVLQVYAASLPDGFDCPWCTKPPQAGCLTSKADGLAFELICSLCLRRRSFPRARCPGCSETSESKLSNFTTPDYPHLRLLACDSCHSYLHVVDLSRDLAAIPEVDEIAGLPLDLWAVEHGYHKLQPNLAGV